ncbi:response regulator [Flammeovirga aprica]|uniref:Response regulator n=1 Tax=Flammeovirga aprica JL-4 TaxID=694437 RepID=A0A7X9P201_9BACT|nr:response regulator [Flammeovirga aprica]NME67552.1 response regulator [Flammeovirga aprica JL-4]
MMTHNYDIILVDDDAIANQISKINLQRCNKNVSIQEFDKSVNFLKFLRQNRESNNILLDLDMPLVSGWDILEEIDIVGLSDVYNIIVLSTSDLVQDRIRSKSYDSVKAYISKPLNKNKTQKIFQIFENCRKDLPNKNAS